MIRHRFAVRVKPGAAKTRVGGRHDGRFGAALVVAVTAPAVDGRANDAVRRALADAFGVAQGRVTVVAGAHARDKLIEIEPAPDDARAVILSLIGEVPPTQGE
ncbi:MAG TPA: DUF167 domain-containing protein [Pseudonocardiaceae bacterium]|nr:DUF167 domain-containing protein [Pseudonocardiaceae bacterium]